MSDAQVPTCLVHFRHPCSQACQIYLYCSLHTIRVSVCCLMPCMLPAAIAVNDSCQHNNLHGFGTASTCLALERQDLSCTYLAHHELESGTIIIIFFIFIYLPCHIVHVGRQYILHKIIFAVVQSHQGQKSPEVQMQYVDSAKVYIIITDYLHVQGQATKQTHSHQSQLRSCCCVPPS